MGTLKEKEILTKEEYSYISGTLSHLTSICEDIDKGYTLSGEQFRTIEQVRDIVDEFEQIMGTNYKDEYRNNLECIDIFKKRIENGEPNNISWQGFKRKFRLCA